MKLFKFATLVALAALASSAFAGYWEYCSNTVYASPVSNR